MYVDLMNVTQIMSNLYFDLSHYNVKANARIDECTVRKKDLENILFKIGQVQQFYSEYMSTWTKCLKNDFAAKITNIKTDITANKKKLKELTAIREELELKYDLGQCNKLWTSENQFIDKASKGCASNAATIKAQVTAITKWLDNENVKMADKTTK